MTAALLAEQLAFDFAGIGDPGPELPTELHCARHYWAPWQLAACVMNKAGSPVYSREISHAVASQRGRYGRGLSFQTVRRGVEFRATGDLLDSQPHLITWRRLWNVVREYAADREDLAHALVLAVVADRSARQREWEATNPIHLRTMHPTPDEQALIHHHHELTYATYCAVQDAVEKFWADAT